MRNKDINKYFQNPIEKREKNLKTYLFSFIHKKLMPF